MVKKQQQGGGLWDNGGYIEPQLSQARPTRPVFGGAGPFVDNGRYGRPAVDGGAAALRPLHFQHQTPSARLALPFGGSGGFAIKRERSGTGVFLPRRYGNNNNSHKPVDSAPKTEKNPSLKKPIGVVELGRARSKTKKLDKGNGGEDI